MRKLSRKDFLKLSVAALLSAAGGTYFALLRRTVPGGPGTPRRKDAARPPSYLKLHKTGELRKRGEDLWNVMRSCAICPRKCGIDRIAGTEGFCHASAQLEVSSYHPHFGEEPPLVGKHGSGTIFFTNCGLRCVFCINWDISLEGHGQPRSIDELAGMMMDLQSRGCHNINLVTPTHYLPHIVLAVDKAAGKGLKLPLVYNTCGWERVEILRYLDGVIDIYLPDFKYSSGAMAAKYSSGAKSYPEITQMALLEMQRQVGVAKLEKDGLVRRGLMLRHLVMPNEVGGTKEVLKWVGENLPRDTFLNLMSQYRPCYMAFSYPEIARGITVNEYRDAIRWAEEAGLTNVRRQY